MKPKLFFKILICINFISCSGYKEKQNLAHLSAPDYQQSKPTSDKIGNYDLYRRMQHYNVPGLSIAVVKDGEILWAEGYGKANIASNKEVDTNTLFQAASISKAIAAVGIMKLVEQGVVDLDTDVNEYLEEYRIPENNFTKAKKVTLRAILSHTAGLNVEGFGGYNTNDRVPSTNDILTGTGNTDAVIVNTLPESKWHYSGGGYTVIQKVIEDVTNKTFEDFMQVQILEPLGMTNSTFTQPLPQKYHSNTSSAFDSEGGLIDGKWHNYPEKAAAGLWTTPSDLAKYCIAIQNIYLNKTTKGILSKETVEMMFTDHYSFEYFSPTTNIPANYKRFWGLGTEVATKGEIIRFQHGGFNEGFKANLTAFANKGIAVVIMANADNGFDLIMEIEKALSDKYGLGIWQ